MTLWQVYTNTRWQHVTLCWDLRSTSYVLAKECGFLWKFFVIHEHFFMPTAEFWSLSFTRQSIQDRFVCYTIFKGDANRNMQIHHRMVWNFCKVLAQVGEPDTQTPHLKINIFYLIIWNREVTGVIIFRKCRSNCEKLPTMNMNCIGNALFLQFLSEINCHWNWSCTLIEKKVADHLVDGRCLLTPLRKKDKSRWSCGSIKISRVQFRDCVLKNILD